MTDKKLDLPGTNSYRSTTPVRQLDATALGISAPATQGDEEIQIWDELHDAIEAVPTDGISAAVATTNKTIATAIDLHKGSSQPIHALELGVWKAYSETQSPVTHVLVQAGDNDYTPCGRCLQTVLDYSSDALVRIESPSVDGYDEFSLDRVSILTIGEGSDEHQGTETDIDTPTEDESESISVPGNPPFADAEIANDAEVEYVRLNAPVYHLKYRTHAQTFCGTDLTHRESVSSSEKPTLLDPCKSCHGETSHETVEEQQIRLRGQLSSQVDQVRAIGNDAATFNEEELTAILRRLPVETPSGGTDAAAIRERLSRTVVGVHDEQDSPLTFSRAEMESLSLALEGEGTISDDSHLFAYTSDGRVARIALSNLSLQHRAGKGELALSMSNGEVPTTTFGMSPRDELYVFTNLGQVHQLDAHRVPAVSRGDEPTPLSEIIDFEEDEILQAAFACSELEDHDYVIIGSKDGIIKRTATDEFENIHRGGIRAVELEGDDLLRAACLMNGDQDLLMSTQNGRIIRFDGTDVRPMGRTARGVKGIKLDDGDEVVAVNVVNTGAGTEVFTVTAEGYGKRTAIDEYRRQSRNGRGLLDILTGGRNGPVVAVEMVSSSDEFVTMSESGRTIHAAADEISVQGRNTMGVQIMGLNPDDLLSNLTVFDH